MSLLQLLIGICLIVLGFWANNTYITPGIIRTAINVVLIIIVLVVILSFFGLTGFLTRSA